MTTRKILIYGATGQAKMIRTIANSMFGRSEKLEFHLVDGTDIVHPPFVDHASFYNGKDAYQNFKRQCGSVIGQFDFAIAIGNPNGARRIELHDQLSKDGLRTQNWVHKTAYIDPDAIIGVGNHIHPHAILNPQVIIGNSCIINTRALVEHGCRIGSGVEIGPAATLCGQIIVEDHAWIGAGATILPNLVIGKEAVVGAGAVVTKNVEVGQTVVGVPARPMK